MGHVERRKRETLLQFLWHLSDLIAILVAFALGYWLRFHSPLVGPLWDLSKGIPPLAHYLAAAGATAVVWILVFHAFGLYRFRLRWEGPAVSTLLRASLLGMVLTAGIAFFYRDVTFSRIAVPLIWIIAVPLLHVGRRAMLALAARITRRAPLRFVIIGRTAQGMRIARALAGGGAIRHDPIGVLAGPGEPLAADLEEEPLPLLGRYDEIGAVVARERIDRVIVALPLVQQHGLIEVLRQCRPLDVDVEFVPDLMAWIPQPGQFDEIDGVPLASLRRIRLAGWNGVVKRALDLAITIPVLIFLGPLMLLLAVVIKLTSPGPVFFRQRRVGRDRKFFEMIKFRSMRVDAEEATGPVWTDALDQRRTAIGRFMRTWSLDELPQLLNVLRGEMSLVGPRPERPYFVERFEQLVPGYFERHAVKSGITGWAQVNGLRGNVPIEERTRFDLHYIENWSLGFDLRILVLTLRSILAQRGH
ncbi:MAG: undecaprenyl-phosphate glucose phosphotransferase [Candidatus Eisenbacteria bacterium]|nr:undecaprenyl-phosphate glucose phosphotransferase [Candidatus Eisenbacteria bacterium]